MFREGELVAHQVYLVFHLSDWLFLDSVHFADKEKGTLDVVARDTQVGGVTEEVAVKLSDERLKAAAEAGLEFRVYGRGMIHETLNLKPLLFRGHLLALERGPSTTADSEPVQRSRPPKRRAGPRY